MIFKSSKSRLPGSNGAEIYRHANAIYKKIASKTKRRPYIRSKYFNKEKIFLDYFWGHLDSKNWTDRIRRLSLYNCAIDLLIYTTSKPEVVTNPNRKDETFYRFYGVTREMEKFVVQIVEKTQKREKSLISVYPIS